MGIRKVACGAVGKDDSETWAYDLSPLQARLS